VDAVARGAEARRLIRCAAAVSAIPAHHGGLYALSDSNQHSGPGIVRPEKWAHAYEDRAGRRVIFITDEVVFGQLVREQVFAYASGIEFDSAAFDTFFPVAGLPPAEHPRPLTTQAAPGIADPAPASAAPPVNPGGRHDRDLVLEEAEPVIADPARAPSAAPLAVTSSSSAVSPLKVPRDEWLDQYLTEERQADLTKRHNGVTSATKEIHELMKHDPTVEAYAHARNIERHPIVRRLFPPSRPSKKKKG
jgi:hypothetical protein